MINNSASSYWDHISANCTRNHIAGRLAGWALEPPIPLEEFANMTCAVSTFCHWGPGHNLVGLSAPHLMAENDTGVAPIGNHRGESFLLDQSVLLVGSTLMFYCNKPGKYKEVSSTFVYKMPINGV